MSDECVLCFTEIEDNEDRIRCINSVYKISDCSRVFCGSCFTELLKQSSEHKLLTCCTGSECRMLFKPSDVKKIDISCYNIYIKSIIDHLMLADYDEINKLLMYDKIIQDIRKQRMKHIQESYPSSVFAVANIVFSDKLKRVNKDLLKRKQEKETEKDTLTKRVCLNIRCNGKLSDITEDSSHALFGSEVLVCNICENKFCKKCEKIYDDSQHICNEQDIRSVELVNSYIRCPKCAVPVEKSMGCRNMTCATCGTMFDYYTGEVGLYGGHFIHFNMKKIYKLANVYKDNIPDEETLNLLITFESMKPTEPSDKSYKLMLKLYVNKINSGTNVPLVVINMLINKYFEYITQRYKYKKYMAIINSMEKELIKKQLTPEYVQISIDMMKVK